jgi:hypothetical protein
MQNATTVSHWETVLRLGAVYSSRIKGNYERLLRALACNRFIAIGSGLNRRTLVYDYGTF